MQSPPPSDITPAPQLADELEIDLGEPDEEQVLDHDHGTLPEGVTYLGTYSSIEAYLRAQLEPEISSACSWIFDYIDWKAVQRRFEGPDTRLFCESGAVYQVGP